MFSTVFTIAILVGLFYIFGGASVQTWMRNAMTWFKGLVLHDIPATLAVLVGGITLGAALDALALRPSLAKVYGWGYVGFAILWVAAYVTGRSLLVGTRKKIADATKAYQGTVEGAKGEGAGIQTNSGQEASATPAEPSAKSPPDSEGSLKRALRAFAAEDDAGHYPARGRVRFTGAAMTAAEKDKDAAEMIEAARERMRDAVRGQDHAIEAVIRAVRRSAAGVRLKPDAPLLTALFAGPTGTGKTELALQVAAALKKKAIRYDMPNYSSLESLWSLVGSAEGFVGGEGKLIADLRAHPGAVIVFDEVEKAHPDLWQKFALSLFDAGTLTSLKPSGGSVSAKDAMIFLTSNLLGNLPPDSPPEQARDELLKTGYFRPEMVNRLNPILIFNQLSRQVLAEIIERKLDAFLSRVLEDRGLELVDLEVHREVIDAIASKCDTKYGARDAQRWIEALIADPLAEAILSDANIHTIRIAAARERVSVEVS